MNQIVARSTSKERFNMLLMSVFAGAALLLAAIGVYGLMAYSVLRRTQEIGIRLALVAVWLPAVRATRINPIDALRYE